MQRLSFSRIHIVNIPEQLVNPARFLCLAAWEFRCYAGQSSTRLDSARQMRQNLFQQKREHLNWRFVFVPTVAASLSVVHNSKISSVSVLAPCTEDPVRIWFKHQQQLQMTDDNLIWEEDSAFTSGHERGIFLSAAAGYILCFPLFAAFFPTGWWCV